MFIQAKGKQKSQEPPPPRNVLSAPHERLQHEAQEAMTYGENMWCQSQRKPCQIRKTDMK